MLDTHPWDPKVMVRKTWPRFHCWSTKCVFMVATATFSAKKIVIAASATSTCARFVQPIGNTAPITTTAMCASVFAVVQIKCIVVDKIIKETPREAKI